MKQHQCTYSKVCCCDILGLEPSEKCPVHSGYPEKPQCDICGRFLNVKHQVADHASDEYLTGLSDLDRARAIVAVRWCGARWQKKDLRLYKTPGRSLCNILVGEDADGTEPLIVEGLIDSFRCEEVLWRVYDWGTNWTGTASLMELAESKGWRLSGSERSRLKTREHHRIVLWSDLFEDAVAATADTHHSAVLLACAKAAQREKPK